MSLVTRRPRSGDGVGALGPEAARMTCPSVSCVPQGVRPGLASSPAFRAALSGYLSAGKDRDTKVLGERIVMRRPFDESKRQPVGRRPIRQRPLQLDYAVVGLRSHPNACRDSCWVALHLSSNVDPNVAVTLIPPRDLRDRLWHLPALQAIDRPVRARAWLRGEHHHVVVVVHHRPTPCDRL